MKGPRSLASGLPMRHVASAPGRRFPSVCNPGGKAAEEGPWYPCEMN